MLEICFGTYLVLGLPALLLLWTALAAASRIHDMEEGHDRQSFYRIALAISNFKKSGYRKEYDLLEDPAPS